MMARRISWTTLILIRPHASTWNPEQDHVTGVSHHAERANSAVVQEPTTWFNQHISKICKQFIKGQKCRRPTIYLLTLKQGEIEPFRDFMVYFNREKLSVDNHYKSVVLVAAQLLHRALPRRTPSTLQYFMDKAKEFMNAEDTIKAFTDQS